MAKFKVKVMDSAGVVSTIDIEAPDRKRLFSQISNQGLKAIKIDSIAEDDGDGKDIEKIDLFKESKKKFSFLSLRKNKELIALEFLKRLHVLLSSGMSLGDALSLMSKRLSDPALQKMCQTIWKSLSEGKNLAASMRDYSAYFSPSTFHLIEAGEASGNLLPVLRRVIAYLEESREVKQRLKSSLAYPVLILSVSISVVVFLLVVLLPKIKDILGQLGGELPAITQFLISSADFTKIYGIYFLAAIVALVISIVQWRKTSNGRKKTDFWLLRIPLIGKIYLYSDIYSTTNLMSTLLSSGINTTETLRLVEKSIANTILKVKFSIARKQIQEGVSMATAIQRVRYMPELAMDILNVGENTGNLTSSLDDINKIYRNELTKALNYSINFVVSLALGGAILLVVVIALSVVLSVLSVSQSIQM